jgi:hypothetical protein
VTEPIPPPAGDYTPAEWQALYQECFAASSRVLSFLQGLIGIGDGMNPQQAGIVLLLCMGRLQGRYGFRNVSVEKAWEAWVGSDLRPLFEAAFREERAQEH